MVSVADQVCPAFICKSSIKKILQINTNGNGVESAAKNVTMHLPGLISKNLKVKAQAGKEPQAVAPHLNGIPGSSRFHC